MAYRQQDRAPAVKLGLAMLMGLLLTIPIFSVYLLVYDRENQSKTARESIAQGWGGEQTLAGPLLVIPYQAQVTETVTQNGKPSVTSRMVTRELRVAPTLATLDLGIDPERRHRSIYEAIVYTARASGSARFDMPTDLARAGIAPETLDLARAELRFGVSDPRGLVGRRPSLTIAGRAVALQPGNGPEATGGSGFFAGIDARALPREPLMLSYRIDFRGNGSVSMVPQAGESRWKIASAWPHPSFQGGFLPIDSRVDAKGCSARYAIGNLALGRALVDLDQPSATNDRVVLPGNNDDRTVKIALVAPADIYSQVNRAVKYGFLFIGFTFTALLMFDVIGGRHVSTVAYLLVGAGLVLFFVMLLAFAELIGFTFAYLLAAGAMIALLTAYSAAVLGNWRRAAVIFGLLAMLYLLLFVLLSLEAWSLLIGSVLLFATLATVMYITRNVDWSRARAIEAAPA
ncbi:MAG: colicin resistance protein [Proteobacteria bacterium SG_bin5]|nr:MAG: colicin resistance protein [Proteobacteria bacterium SG_bin5]